MVSVAERSSPLFSLSAVGLGLGLAAAIGAVVGSAAGVAEGAIEGAGVEDGMDVRGVLAWLGEGVRAAIAGENPGDACSLAVGAAEGDASSIAYSLCFSLLL